MEQIILYHGSQTMIGQPVFGMGKKYNDYGLAFYCTRQEELAREWAASEQSGGYVNCYELYMEDLSMLDLGCGKYHILNWLAILLDNRHFRIHSELKQQAKQYILDTFLPDYQRFDVIQGYRADDSYFSFANDFLNNGISLTTLEKAMFLGDLGVQVALKSKKAFRSLYFTGSYYVEQREYYSRKLARDKRAREEYHNTLAGNKDGIYMMDILREEWRDDDERLQRMVFGRCDV